MPSLKELNARSWDDRLAARAHTYTLDGRFRFACDRLLLHKPKRWLDIGTGNGFLPNAMRGQLSGVHIAGTDFAENALVAANDALDEKALNDLDQDDLPFAAES
ncbi:MAG: hypothetical protein PHI18_04905, partial [bacterium]|nr:hypothetical protein [bacterium]